MLTSIQNKIKEMNAKFPDWDSNVAAFFESSTPRESGPDEDMLDAFTDLLTSLIELVKTGDIAVEDAVCLLDDYACQSYASKYIKFKLRSYNNYKPLRELAEADIYKAKCCVDLIWSSYVLRFNPHLVFDDSVPLKEADFKNVAAQLDRFTDFCVDRSYSFPAIIEELKEDANFGDILCEYIAGKIDADFEKLKLNYITHRLSMCERALDELSEKRVEK